MKINLSALLMGLAMLALTISCNPTKQTSQQTETVPHSVLVLLKNRVQPGMLEQSFADYKLKSGGPTSRSENRWLFTYDITTIQAEKLIEKLRASEWVLEAQLDTVTKTPKVNTGN